jgi:hypothetical protein
MNDALLEDFQILAEADDDIVEPPVIPAEEDDDAAKPLIPGIDEEELENPDGEVEEEELEEVE